MSIERRLRRDLEQEAREIEVDVERNLIAVETRTRRRGSSLLLPVFAGAAVLVAAMLIRFPATPSVGGPSAAPSPVVTPNPFAAIAGTYRATIDAGADPEVAGTWTMDLRRNGVLVLVAPASFTYGSISPTGISYTIEGDRLRTDLFYNDFCPSVGVYAWSLAGERLTLTPVTEACAIREALLATSPWTLSSAP